MNRYLGLVLFFTTPIFAAGKASPEAPHLWNESCVYCHGNSHLAPLLEGRGLPLEMIRLIVRNGANGMPPFHASEISDSELDALARWITASKSAAAAK